MIEQTSWECGVCGYIHKEAEAPEKCPVCDAPQVMFVEKSDNKEEQLKAGVDDKNKVKQWRCTVCGYIHTGDTPPEKCPICSAPSSMFVEIDAAGNALSEVIEATPTEPIFQGEDDNTADGESKIVSPPKEVVEGDARLPATLDKLAGLVLKFHLHPISAHFPNGILPAAVLFLALGLYFNIAHLETAAYYNLIFVLINLPVVLFTGFLEWQKRYKGIKTPIFLTKIICALIVIGTVNVLVFWRLIDPNVTAEGSASRYIYFGISVGMLAATGLAGHLGGKLVHGSRN